MFYNFFFFNFAVYEIMWKDIAGAGRPQMTICCMRIACWIPKATDTHSQYVPLITYPLQQRLNKRPLMLFYTFIAYLAMTLLPFNLTA
jgi:hypothetical protein